MLNDPINFETNKYSYMTQSQTLRMCLVGGENKEDGK